MAEYLLLSQAKSDFLYIIIVCISNKSIPTQLPGPEPWPEPTVRRSGIRWTTYSTHIIKNCYVKVRNYCWLIMLISCSTWFS